MKRKIKSLHTSLIAAGDEIISLVMAIDDDGVAWEFVAGKWVALSELPAYEVKADEK